MSYFDQLRATIRDLEVTMEGPWRRANPLEYEEFQILLDQVRMETRAEITGWIDCLDLDAGSMLQTAYGLACKNYFLRLAGKLRALANYAIDVNPNSEREAENVLSVAEALENRTRTDTGVLPSLDNLETPKMPLWIKGIAALLVLNTLANIRG